MTATRAHENSGVTLLEPRDDRRRWLTRLSTPLFEQLSLRWLDAVGLTDLGLRDRWGTGLVEGTGMLLIGGEKTSVVLRCVADTRPLSVADIQNFRLVLGRHGERGLYVTSAAVTDEAREAATAPGELPVLLVDGHQFLECLMAAGDVVCHEPSNTWMVVDRSRSTGPEPEAQNAGPAPVAVAV